MTAKWSPWLVAACPNGIVLLTFFQNVLSCAGANFRLGDDQVMTKDALKVVLRV
ncbi:MAG: hypothetical protein KJS97_13110 [Alphaproteobacteria bacterium]|nr:hypothetical protein [Alphaproteobacteria bacterium]